MITWEPKTNGFFIDDFRKKLKEKNFPDEDINKVVENAKDALSKTINPNNPENNNETFKTESCIRLHTKWKNHVYGSCCLYG